MAKTDTSPTDDTPLGVRDLAAYMTVGKNAIYRDITAGYVFEFVTLKRTTPRHYKAWLRKETDRRVIAAAELSQGDQERLQRELRRLHSTAGKSNAPLSNRDSQTASPRRAKSSGSAQPV